MPNADQRLEIGLISLPFLEPQVTCFPALLLGEIAAKTFSNVHCTTVHGHSEFALEFLQDPATYSAYQRLTREPYLGDLCLIPLLAGTSDDVLAERAALLPDADINIEFADALMDAFANYVTKCALRLQPCKLVGITATHFQLVPSLIFARALKALGADAPKVVLGGYLSSPSIARALLDTHVSLDIVVFGEAEEAWPNAIRHCLDGAPRDVLIGGATKLDTVKPQVASVIEEFRGTWIGKYLQVTLEISRGCYWDKCDFCNFNAAYKSHFLRNDFDDILDEMDQLDRDHGQKGFVFLDTAIPPSFVKHLRKKDVRRDYQIFAEVRPDFSRSALEDFARLGALKLQIGIESLVDSHLEMMVKNASVVDNVRSLLACKKLGITVIWGVFVDHPKETTEHLNQMLWRLQNWQHLPAPKYVTHCQLRPGSPLWLERNNFGHQVTPTTRSFEHVLPQVDEALEFFPHVENRTNTSSEHAKLISEIEATVIQWRDAPVLPQIQRIEKPLWRDIIRTIEDQIISPEEVARALAQSGKRWTKLEIVAAMDQMEKENYLCATVRMRRKAPVKVFTPLHLIEDMLGADDKTPNIKTHAIA
ncbi:MAG: radical SAM protein [Rhodobacteraceae bacterium]|nr:radical SAM protein [Paracoccaceae bacterium]